MKYIIEEKNTYHNYDYIIKFFEDGHRCGYVKIPDNHIFYQKNYDDIDIDCHGGLTFSELSDGNDLEKGYWIGFDCAHFDDKYDTDNILKHFGIDALNRYYQCAEKYVDDSATVKSLDFVRNECKKIIQQLKEYENEN